MSECPIRRPDQSLGQIRAIVRELLPMLGPYHPELEETVKDVCARRMHLRSYNTPTVRRAIEDVTGIPLPAPAV